MSAIYEDVRIDVVLPHLKIMSKKQVFQNLGKVLSEHIGRDAASLCHQLLARDKDQRVIVQDGLAVAPLRIKGLKRVFKILITLHKPVDFGGVSDRPVDIICGVFSPEDDGALHLRRLSRISRFFANHDLQQKLRNANTEDEIRAILTSPDGWLQAA